MSEDGTASPISNERSLAAERQQDLVWWATWAGLLLAGVGLVDGVWMTTKRKAVTCADGTYFPQGTTDHTCYAHPQAGIGIAVAVLSVVLGILVVFSSIVARASLAGREESSVGPPTVHS